MLVRLTEILDGRGHLSHTYNIRDGAFGGNQTVISAALNLNSPSQGIRIFFPKLLEDDHAKLAE